MKSTASLIVSSLIVGGIIVIGLSWANAPAPKASSRSPRSNAQTEAPNEFNAVPSDANASDKALMARWYNENELCQGSSDKKTIDVMCSKREDTGNLLSKHGWCWAYSDWRVYPTDYKWHSCSIPRPEGFVPKQELNNSDNDLPEMDPEGSQLFEDYKITMGDLDIKLGNATAVRLCGIRTLKWYKAVLQLYWEAREPLLAGLHKADRPFAEQFDRARINDQKVFALGGTEMPTDEGCRALAATPMPYRDDLFIPNGL